MLLTVKIKLSFHKEMGFLLLPAQLLYFFPMNKFSDSSCPQKRSGKEGESDCWQ